MGLTLYISPTEKYYARRQYSDGIHQVLQALGTHLPRYGWSFTNDPRQADIRASHAGSFDGIAEVAHCHGLYPTAELNDVALFGMNSRVIRELRQATRVSVPSDWVAEMFRRDMHLDPVVLGHGIETKEYPAPEYGNRPATVLWDKNRPGDVCSPRPMMELAARCPAVKFISTFGTPADNVEVRGLMPHEILKKLRQEVGVYLSTTKETFGIATIEAMASGLPVLGFDWGGTRDIVEHEATGYLVKPGDIEGLARGLDYCLAEGERLGRAARKEALKYDWSKVIQKYDQLYREVLGERVARPLVSVVIPCYNYAQYVGEAIASVQAQSYSQWECFVVDDGSSDGSRRAIIEAVGDDTRIHFVGQENQGVAAARNRGAELAQGKYMMFLDADDAIAPAMLETLVPAMEKDRALGIAYSGIQVFGTTSPSRWPGAFDPKGQFGHRNQVPSCCLIRREAFDRAGGFRQRCAPAEDAELWTLICALGFDARQVVPYGLFHYRMRSGTASSAVREQRRGEPDWLAWVPGGQRGTPIPFASLKPLETLRSHPVRNYDRPDVSVVLFLDKDGAGAVCYWADLLQAQAFWKWELICADLGKVQKSLSRLMRESTSFIRWQKANSPGQALNLCTKTARGEWLLLAAQNTELSPDRLRAILSEPLSETAVSGEDAPPVCLIRKALAAGEVLDGTISVSGLLHVFQKKVGLRAVEMREKMASPSIGPLSRSASVDSSILVEYTGGQSGSAIWVGAVTRKKYRFDQRENRVQAVLPLDVPAFLEKQLFRLAR